MDVQQFIKSNPALGSYSHFSVKFKVLGTIPGVSNLPHLLYNQLFATQLKVLNNQNVQLILPRVTPLTIPFSHNTTKPYFNGTLFESIQITEENEAVYHYAFNDNNQILIPNIGQIENVTIWLFYALMDFINRYSEYLTFEFYLEHDTNCDVAFIEKCDLLSSGVSPLLTYKAQKGILHYTHLIPGDDVHRVLEGIIYSFSDNANGLNTPAYNMQYAEKYYQECIK